MFNLRSIDLNLLPVFEAVYEEHNLSRAAQRLGMSQSAVSHALARLRDLLRDDLFVRLPQGVQRTPLADLAYPHVRDALAGVRDLLGETRLFDPLSSTRRFHLAIPHPLGPMLADCLQQQLELTAPGLVVDFSTRSLPVDLERKLEDGRVDMALDWLRPEGGSFIRQELFRDRMVLGARLGHAAFLAETFDELRDLYPFVSTRNRLPLEQVWVLPEALRHLPVNRLLMMSEQLEVLLAASRSERIAIVPLSLGRVAGDSFGLEMLPLSPASPEIPVNLVWHQSRNADPAHSFLRGQLISAVHTVVDGGKLQLLPLAG
jgi:DNA-binding transcriptional LysR family regulator